MQFCFQYARMAMKNISTSGGISNQKTILCGISWWKTKNISNFFGPFILEARMDLVSSFLK